jgi:hypothetical protein
LKEYLNPPPPSKEPNLAAVSRGYGSLGLAANSSQTLEPVPDLPENAWETPALIRGLREAVRAKEVKWP